MRPMPALPPVAPRSRTSQGRSLRVLGAALASGRLSRPGGR